MYERDILNPILTIEASLEITEDFDADFGEIYNTGTEYPAYPGPYEVSPTFEVQLLSTKDLRMTQNVKVNAITRVDRLNEDGSTTVIIGGS